MLQVNIIIVIFLRKGLHFTVIMMKLTSLICLFLISQCNLTLADDMCSIICCLMAPKKNTSLYQIIQAVRLFTLGGGVQ